MNKRLENVATVERYTLINKKEKNKIDERDTYANASNCGAENTAITLIALIITIIVLLILAGVTLNMVMGDSGIFSKAIISSEETKRKQAIETVQTSLLSARMEYILNKNIEVKDFVEKENKEIQVEQTGTGEPLDSWDMTYNGYTFQINDLKIIGIAKGNDNPKVKNLIVTENYQFATTGGNYAKVEFEISLPEKLQGATVTVTSPISENAIVSTVEYKDGKYTGTITTNGTDNPNGEYAYEIKATRDGEEKTVTAIAKVEKFLNNPTIEITENKNDRFTINVTNNYPADANLKYKYYYSTTTTYPNAEFETVTSKEITGLSGVTTYNIKVEVYLKDVVTFKEVTTQNTTEDLLINLESLQNDNEIYLIKDGKENLVSWSLYNPSNGHSVQYEDGYLSYGGGSPYTYSNYRVNAKVDLTNFQKIIIDAGCDYVGGGCDAYFISTYPYTTGFKDQGDTTGLVRYSQVTENSRKLYEIDVNDLNGYYYIGMTEGYYRLYVYNYYLVKK